LRLPCTISKSYVAKENDEGHVMVRIAQAITKKPNLERDLADAATRTISLRQCEQSLSCVTLNGEELCCISDFSTHVGTLLEQIAAGLDAPVSQFRILHGAQSLRDDDTIDCMDSVAVQYQLPWRDKYDKIADWPSYDAERFAYWPFRGVVWLCSPFFLAHHFHPSVRAARNKDTYYGNAACVDIFTYRQAALFIEVSATDPEVLPFAPDLAYHQGR